MPDRLPQLGRRLRASLSTTLQPLGRRATLLGGVGAGALAAAHLDVRRREHDVAERERSLTSQRSALVQLVSHEFRTPLTVIRGSLQTLRRPEAGIDDRFVDLLDATMRAVDRLEDMAEVILAASDDIQLADAVESLVELAELVRDVARSLGPDVDARLELHLDADARLVTVEPYLWLTIRCLLDNAVKFSPPGEPIEVTFEAADDLAVIILRDHGPGLPPGFEGDAFEPFTQADPSLRRPHEGLGMGLYSARRLARRLGGDVELRSLGDDGTSAEVILPRSHQAALEPSHAALR